MVNVTETDSQRPVLPSGTLLVIRGANVGVRYELGERTRIGRDSTNEIVLADPNVSRLHAEIVRSRFAYAIRDCDSRNGVFVNGVLVKEKQLLRNDEIRIGTTVFLFNPDLKIENALLSHATVVQYPGEDVTQEFGQRGEALEVSLEREGDLVKFLAQLAEVFSLAPGRTEEVGQRLLEHLRDLFQADHVLLMLREPATDKLRTLLSWPEETPTLVNRELISRAYLEKRPCLASDRPETLTRIPLAGHGETAPLRSAATEKGLTMMAAPILAADTCLGLLVVQKRGIEAYSLKDLALLQALAKLSSGLIRTAQLADYLDLHPMGDQSWQMVSSRNPKMRGIIEQALRVAPTDASVVITGESGTGKEVLARMIHEASRRRRGPFVALNCGAIPPTLFESELFGYEKGAFTGAYRTMRGKIEAAHGGTLFLDEIGNLDLALQPKLLRFLQERAFYRVGGTRPLEADVRIVAATNTDLEAAVRLGRFREDLWYRLNVVSLHLPPLRERREDIAPLAEHFVRQATRRSGKGVLGLDDSALSVLERYDWPGNIRELSNAIERAVILASRPILTGEDFAFLRRESSASTRSPAKADPSQHLTPALLPLAEVERCHIESVLTHCGWNQAKAAEILGVHRNTLRNKIIEYGLHRPPQASK